MDYGIKNIYQLLLANVRGLDSPKSMARPCLQRLGEALLYFCGIVEGFSFANREARRSSQLILFQRIDCANVTESFISHEHQPQPWRSAKKLVDPSNPRIPGEERILECVVLAAYRYRSTPIHSLVCIGQRLDMSGAGAWWRSIRTCFPKSIRDPKSCKLCFNNAPVS